MSLKEIVDRDCGGSNPLMKLTSHFTEDKALKQHGIGRPHFSGPGLPLAEARHDELVNEFLAPNRFDLMPTSFQMDSLLREVEEIEKLYSAPLTEPANVPRQEFVSDSWVRDYVQEPVDHANWTHAFLNDVPYDGESVKQRPVGSPDWVHEFLNDAPVPPTQISTTPSANNLWADEFLELSEKRTQIEESQAPGHELAATVDDLLKTVDSDDPKFKNSKFIQFLHGVKDGSIKLAEKPSQSSDLVAGDGDRWVNEFVTGQQRGRTSLDDEDAWVQEYVQTDFGTPVSFENWSREMNMQNNLANEWADEFQAENNESHFWENLQKQWEDLAKQGAPEVQDWLTTYENFDASTYYKDYTFEDTNPLLDHPDAFKEGLERLKKGEIPNAVLLFEAAVQKQPDHAEVINGSNVSLKPRFHCFLMDTALSWLDLKRACYDMVVLLSQLNSHGVPGLFPWIWAWQYLGTTQAANEQDPAAIAALQKCLELNQGNLTALMALAVSYTNEALQHNACTALSDWIRHNPKYSHLLTSDQPPLSSTTSPRVSSFMSVEYYQQVEDLYLKAVQSSPQEIDADIQIGLGILLNLSNEYDKAVDCFKAALQLRPDDALIWNKLGATLSNGGRSAEAVEAFRRALDVVPGYIRTRYNLGLACLNLGADREAMEHFLTALSLQKSSSGLKGTSAVMSDNIWSSVRTAITKMGCDNLVDACDKKDLDTLKGEFHIDV